MMAFPLHDVVLCLFSLSKPDMSRLRLAAACALLKLAQEPCYHEIITLEQYQLCSLVINVRTRPAFLMAQTVCVRSQSSCCPLRQDECYQVRQCFSQKLHRGLCRLRLPLEYMAVFALCAKDPVKERRAHARQCLVKNVNIRREYLKQHAALSGKEVSLFCQRSRLHVWLKPHKLWCDEAMLTVCQQTSCCLCCRSTWCPTPSTFWHMTQTTSKCQISSSSKTSKSESSTGKSVFDNKYT